MKLADWLILAIVAVLVAVAVLLIFRGKAGGCCGDCSRCHKDCSKGAGKK